jgi:hypothetical protein
MNFDTDQQVQHLKNRLRAIEEKANSSGATVAERQEAQRICQKIYGKAVTPPAYNHGQVYLG